MFKSKFWQHIKQQVIAGIIFLIPLFVVITIVQKLWKALSGMGTAMAESLIV